MKIIYIVAFSLLITAFSFAQKPIHNWTGFYIGPNLGFSSNKMTLGTNNTSSGNSFGDLLFYQVSGVFVPGRGIVIVPGTARPTPLGASSKTSFSGGVQLGYYKQFNNFVAGLESDVNFVSANVRNDVDDSLPPTALSWIAPYGVHHTAKVNLEESFRAKFGYATNNSLVYVTGGIVFTNFKTTAADYYSATRYWPQPPADNQQHPTPSQVKFVSTANNEAVSMSATGYTFGIGYELACSQNCSVGIEYRYTDISKNYSTSESSVDTSAITQHPIYGGFLQSVPEKVKITSSQVTLRLNFMLSRSVIHERNRGSMGKR